jgi:DNA-directed RNA polymerase specialized sigma24 family protein
VESSLTGRITGRAEVNPIDEAEHRTTAGLPDLVRAAQGGDSMAMAELLDVLAPYVARLCGPIALDDGADAAQEALITIFTQLGQLREPAALFGWARVIAIREAVRDDVFVRAIDYITDPSIAEDEANAILEGNATALLGRTTRKAA